MSQLILNADSAEQAARQLYEKVREMSAEMGMNPDIECALWSPERDREQTGESAWRVVWESGPFEWGVSVSLECSFFAAEGIASAPEVVLPAGRRWLAEPYWAFDIGFYQED